MFQQTLTKEKIPIYIRNGPALERNSLFGPRMKTKVQTEFDNFQMYRDLDTTRIIVARWWMLDHFWPLKKRECDQSTFGGWLDGAYSLKSNNQVLIVNTHIIM